jgi:PAS domain S-box-containing protein
MNNEVNLRAIDLDRLNLFFEGVLGALGVAVMVIDAERTVQVWNSTATDMWGLNATEVADRDVMTLDFGLPVAQLDDAISRALGGAAAPIEERVPAVNRRGVSFECRVRLMPLRARTGEAYGAIVLMEPDPLA